MKKFFAIVAVIFALVLTGCSDGTTTDNGNPDNKLPSLTVRNQSSFVLTDVKFSNIPFSAPDSNDLPVSGQSVKKLTADDVGKPYYLTFKRKDIGIICRTERSRTFIEDDTWTLTDETMVEELGNTSNRKTLREITFLSTVAVEYDGRNVGRGDEIDLGSSVISYSKQNDFVLKNTGVGKMLFDVNNPVRIEDAENVFSVVQQPSSSEIASNSSLPFRINFNPKAEKAYTATVTIISNDERGDFIFTVRAVGVPPKPIASVFYGATEISQNGTIDAGGVIITQPEDITITIKNIGQLPLTLDRENITITGSNAAVFNKLTNPGDTISAGGQTSFIIKCDPVEPGENHATLTIPTNDTSRNPVVVLLKMLAIKGSAVPELSRGDTVIPHNVPFDFGQARLGSYKDITFTIKNTGNIVLELLGDPTVESSNPVFAVTSQPENKAINPNLSTSFTVRYTPTTDLENTGILTIAYNENEQFVLNIKGKGMLDAPAGVTTVFQQPNSILVSWNPVPMATSYKIYYGTSSTSITVLLDNALTETSYTHTGLSDGTTYFYCITAQNGAVESDRSQAISMITLPGIPGNLRSTASTYNSINLAWGVVTGATSYMVYYATSAEGSKTLASTATTASYAHTNLPSNTTYYYFVTAANSTGEGAYTEALSARTLLAPLSAPNNVTATALSTNSIQVTWGTVAGATGYKVYRATSANTTATRTLLDTVTTTSFTNGGLSAITYWYYITALNEDNVEGALSESASMIPKPNAPSGVNAYGVDGEVQVRVNWSSVSGAESYRIYYAASSTGAKTLAGSISNSGSSGIYFYYHEGTANTTYHYWVTAVNAGGESDFSLYTADSSAMTPPVAPLNLRVTATTATSVTIAWNAVAGATRYKVTGYWVDDWIGTQTSLIINGYYNVGGTIYVQATNSAGVYGPSASIYVSNFR
jgi:fibronectin type 3 domain-containing protein